MHAAPFVTSILVTLNATAPVTSALPGAYFGQGTGPIHLNRVQCTGAESGLLDCDHERTTAIYDHRKDAGVDCLSKCDINCPKNFNETRTYAKYKEHRCRQDIGRQNCMHQIRSWS